MVLGPVLRQRRSWVMDGVDRSGYRSIEEAIEFARSLAAERDWRFEILDRQPSQIVFQVYDNRTFFGKKFRIDSDSDGAVRIIGFPSGCQSALLGFVALAFTLWGCLAVVLVTSYEPGSDDMSYGYYFGWAVGGVVVGAGISAVLALLGLAWIKRPKRRRAERAFDEMTIPPSEPL